MSTATKAIPINLILNLIWMFWQIHCFMWFIMYTVWQGWYVIALPLFLLLSFIVFISTSCRFMTYQSTTPWSWRKRREQRGRMKENQRWGRQRTGEDITAKKERKYVKKRERMWDRMKNTNERKKKRKQRQARKSEMWAIHKQTSLRDLGPAHLLLFTSEEIDTLWKRGSWPRDKTAAAPN